MKHILGNIQNAASDTAAAVEAELRQRAAAAGWDKKVVNNLRVFYTNNKFQVHIHDKVSDLAFVYEYGDEKNSPTAVLRKYSSSLSPKASSAFMENLEKRSKGGRK